ncbi:MAG: hypothetical protein LUC48_05240 [Clostridiales bacterium]|nr:hypothetical protein [Clostridiales bacterium]
MEKIEVEIESTVQNEFLDTSRPHPVYRKKETRRMELKTEYVLAYGACLRIDDIFTNGCTYEEYTRERNQPFGSPAQDQPRKVGFVKWNKRVRLYVPYPPLDVTCRLYVTFHLPESEKPSLPEMELILPEKKPLPKDDEAWIYPACGATSAAPMFCSNCGMARERKVVVRSNICYFDAKGNVCEKEDAVTCIITEYDQNGNLINSVHGICNLTSFKHSSTALYETDDEETLWLCPFCGASNRFNNKRCLNCGQPR